MKMLHREDLFSWSGFDADRNIDFNSFVWARPGGSVVIDPMPVGDHDLAHLQSLGAVAWIVITNSERTRSACPTRWLLSGPDRLLPVERVRPLAWGSAWHEWLEDVHRWWMAKDTEYPTGARARCASSCASAASATPSR